MHYGMIKKMDVANGPGVRVTLFVSGCTHHCQECCQPETWDFNYGSLFTEDTVQELLEALHPDYIKGLTLLGGEPFEPENQKILLPFLKKVKETFPNKDVWCFTGYLFEELSGWRESSTRAYCEYTEEMLSLIDILVDGEFQTEKKDIGLQFRGSRNQRIIDVSKSMAETNIVWWEHIKDRCFEAPEQRWR